MKKHYDQKNWRYIPQMPQNLSAQIVCQSPKVCGISMKQGFIGCPQSVHYGMNDLFLAIKEKGEKRVLAGINMVMKTILLYSFGNICASNYYYVDIFHATTTKTSYLWPWKQRASSYFSSELLTKADLPQLHNETKISFRRYWIVYMYSIFIYYVPHIVYLTIVFDTITQ